MPFLLARTVAATLAMAAAFDVACARPQRLAADLIVTRTGGLGRRAGQRGGARTRRIIEPRATRAVGAIARDGRRFPNRKMQDAAMAAVSLIVPRPGVRALTAIAGGNVVRERQR